MERDIVKGSSLRKCNYSNIELVFCLCLCKSVCKIALLSLPVCLPSSLPLSVSLSPSFPLAPLFLDTKYTVNYPAVYKLSTDVLPVILVVGPLQVGRTPLPPIKWIMSRLQNVCLWWRRGAGGGEGGGGGGGRYWSNDSNCSIALMVMCCDSNKREKKKKKNTP